MYLVLKFFWILVVVIPATTVTWQQEESDMGIQEKIQLRIKQYSEAQGKVDKEARHRQGQIETLIKHRFSWLLRNTSLPFYFKNKDRESRGKYSVLNHTVVAFVHQLDGSRDTMKLCMENIAEKFTLPISLVTSGEEKEMWDTATSQNNNYRNKYELHWGSDTFGICDSVDKKCSYAAIFQDPLQKMIELYSYCQKFVSDVICVLDANAMSLRDWILQMGSLTFYQLTHQPHICNQLFAMENNSAINRPAHVIPCWYKHKQYMDNNVTRQERHLVLEYVIQNMDKWLSVIGLKSEMTLSMKTFRHVYGEPFRECQRYYDRGQLRTEQEILVDNHANKNVGFRGNDDEAYDENDPENLKQDLSVLEAISEDTRIYQKAKNMFKIQKQMLTNKLK